MACAGLNARSNTALDRAPRLPIIQERDVLLPREADDDPETMVYSAIEEPDGRRRVGAHRVDARVGHGSEVGRDGGGVGIVTVGAGTEGPVRNSSDVQLPVCVEELPADHGSFGKLRCRISPI